MERYFKRKATVDLSWPSKRGGGSTNELGELAFSLQTEVQEMGEAVGWYLRIQCEMGKMI